MEGGVHRYTEPSKGNAFATIFKTIVIGFVILFALGTATFLYVLYSYQPDSSNSTQAVRDLSNNSNDQKFIFLMISDGLGPPGISLTRDYLINNDIANMYLLDTLDSMLVGTSITRSKSDLATDSAAAATALSCGISVPNGFIGMGSDKIPCKTVMEKAKEEGYLTGVITTCGVVDATPAAFTAHIDWRGHKDTISLQQLGGAGMTTNAADLLIGGAGCFFKTGCKGLNDSYRQDSIKVEDVIKEHGWSVKHGRTFVDKVLSPRNSILSQNNSDATFSLPLLNTVVDDYYLSYDIDRDPAIEPSLEELARASIKFLGDNLKESHKGVFMLIEGGRIDTAGHSNDTASYIHDIIAYAKAVYMVKKFVEQHPGSILISVSDHETGGLTLNTRYLDSDGRYTDNWKVKSLAKIVKSHDLIAYEIMDKLKNGTYGKSYVSDIVLGSYLGISNPTSEYVEELMTIHPTHVLDDIVPVLSEIVSDVTDVRWNTLAHTSVDTFVYVYGSDKYIKKLKGAHPSTYIGSVILSLIYDVDITGENSGI